MLGRSSYIYSENPARLRRKLLSKQTFFAWLEQERYDELIGFTVYQYHSVAGFPGGFEFVRELRFDLEKNGDLERLHTLFRGVLPPCYRSFWLEWKHAQKGLLGNITNAAEWKAEILKMLYEYFGAMHRLGRNTAAEKIRNDMILLAQDKKRVIKTSDWTTKVLER